MLPLEVLVSFDSPSVVGYYSIYVVLLEVRWNAIPMLEEGVRIFFPQVIFLGVRCRASAQVSAQPFVKEWDHRLASVASGWREIRSSGTGVGCLDSRLFRRTCRLLPRMGSDGTPDGLSGA